MSNQENIILTNGSLYGVKTLVEAKKIITTKENELSCHNPPKYSEIIVPAGTEVDYEKYELRKPEGELYCIHHVICHQGHSAKSVVHQFSPDHVDYGGQWVLLDNTPIGMV